MFTGIIEEQGCIKEMKQIFEKSITLTISASKVLTDVNRGDSISINGICLTVTDYTADAFMVDVMPETMKSTSLHVLTVGSQVNLERAMMANGRFGGHFLSGHVDSTGEIVHIKKVENAIYYDIKIPSKYQKWIIPKGSISVDGVSLTVFHMEENVCTLSLIPHTASVTTLGDKMIGDVVNIEYDMIGKYVEHLLKTKADE